MYDRRAEFGLYWPLLIEQFLSTTVGMLGTLMVAGIGEHAMGGVGLVDSINLVANGVMGSIASGVTVVIAQCVGRGEERGASKVALQSLVVMIYGALALGVLLALGRVPMLSALFGNVDSQVSRVAQSYLVASSLSMPLLAVFNVAAGIKRAAGDSRSPMVGALLANFAYLGVAWLGVHVLGWGIGGVCGGVIASRIVSAGFMCWVLIRHPGRVALPRFSLRHSLRVDRATLRPVIAVAVPLGADSLIFNGCKVLVQVFMAGMGTAALAANAIAGPITGFAQLTGRAYQTLVVTVAGQTYGAGDVMGARRHTLRITAISSALQVATVALYFLLQTPLLALYTTAPDTLRITRDALFWTLLATPLSWSAAFVTPNGLRAMGYARYTMWISILSMVCARVFGAWLLGVRLGWGVPGVYLAMVLDWFVRGAFYVYKTYSIKPSTCSADLSPSTAADNMPPA